MKRLFRSLFILRVVFQYGLDQLLLELAPVPWLKLLGKILSVGRRQTDLPGKRIRLALESLGPIFVKFGQVLSTRRDLLPTDIADELALLQDKVPPFDSQLAIQTIEKALQKPISEIFVSFDVKPVASASVAQVHFATLLDKSGQLKEVAVKVLRPNMLPTIEKDLSLMALMAAALEKLSVDGKRLKPREVVEEFSRTIRDELDLVREAASSAQLRRNMEGLQLVLIPEMYWDYCRTEVMVMQRMKGIPISQLDKLKQAGVDMKKLASDGVTIFFTQVFRDGYFHADMHPGNIMVSIEPETFGRYISLDFGIVGTLTEVDKQYLVQNFSAFFSRDYKKVALLHVQSGWVPANTRVEELEAAIRAVCEPYFDRPLKEISLGLILLRLFQTSRRFQVEIQPQLVLLQKTLLNIEGLGRQIDPELDLWVTAKPILEKWTKEQIGPQKFFKEVMANASTYAVLLPQLPTLLHSFLSQNSHHKTDLLSQEIHALLLEQKKHHSALQKIIFLVLGFVAGLIVMQFIISFGMY